MSRWLLLLLSSILSSACNGKGIDRWDAMPAVDVLHLSGPYQGQRVCPMCRHGYDAGVIAFLPSTTSTLQLDRFSRRLEKATESIDSPSFRRFLILTGTRPSAERLAAVSRDSAGWYVAWLDSSELPKASHDYRRALGEQPWAAVFSQRRLIWQFDPLTVETPDDKLSANADYAMRFLAANAANAGGNDNGVPEAHGRLWSAPNRIAHAADLHATASAGAGETCIQIGDRPLGDALIQVGSESNIRRSGWARTDAKGCFLLSGIPQDNRVSLEVFKPVGIMQRLALDPADLDPAHALTLTLESRAAVRPVNEPVVGQPCEGCDTVFLGLPDEIPSASRIGATDEPGEPMHISGVVRRHGGRPAPGVIVYAYQTNAAGHYPPAPAIDGVANRHGALRGWAKTDRQGRYSFDSIRPGAYPGRSAPQHVHMHIIEPDRCTYYISDLLFDDDPLLTVRDRDRARTGRGGDGVVVPRYQSGRWLIKRDIELGLQVGGYERCAADRVTSRSDIPASTP